jgi:LysR family nitrogen assimilation transcriptional regulator
LQGIKMLLPSSYHFLRKLIEASFAHVRIAPRVAAEIESLTTLRVALDAGLGPTILPRSAAEQFQSCENLVTRRLIRPAISATISFCQSDHLPLSEAALVVREIVLKMAVEFAAVEGLPPATGPAGRKRGARRDPL